MSYFITLLSYKVDIECIDEERANHLEFLDHYYKKNVFLLSGPQVPRTGGVIFAKANSKEELREIFKEDPFSQKGLAEYTIIEFNPTKASKLLNDIVR